MNVIKYNAQQVWSVLLYRVVSYEQKIFSEEQLS